MHSHDTRGLDHRSGSLIADRRADYAQALAASGDAAAAADLMAQALELVPAWGPGWIALGQYRAEAGDRAGAVDALARASALDPADRFGAGLRLAAMDERDTPATAPAAFVRELFDQYAPRFETALARLDYNAPAALASAIFEAAGPGRRFGRLLDLGCGTGLMGAELRATADHLTGIDLSSGMLAKARARGIYDELREGDILALPGFEAPFDLIVAADVFNYVGDLVPVLSSIAAILAPDGIVAFTVEAHRGPAPYRLGEALRFAHRGDAVAALGQAKGWTAAIERPAVLRADRGQPVDGFLFVFQA